MKNFYLFIRNILFPGQIRLMLAGMAAAFIMEILPGKLFAQAPAISYNSPLTFTQFTAITAQSPTNTGGAVGSFGFNSPALVSTGVSDPVCMAMDKSGNMYIGESSGQVSLLPAGGSTASVYATGFGAVNQMAVDASNNLYLADGANVWKIPAGGGTPVSLNSFSHPLGIALDAAGNVYVSDPWQGYVYKMAADGTGVSTYVEVASGATTLAFGSNGNLYFNTGTQIWVASNERAEGPWSSFAAKFLASDATGNIYAADGTSIKCYFPGTSTFTTGTVSTIATVSSQGLMVDANDNLYYADGHNIYKMTAAGGYFINPLPPSGLLFNSGTGVVSGTPSGDSPATNYTITGFNASGASSATINITVNPALPALSYSSPQSYQVGTAISALSPSSSRVASWSYSAGTTVVSSGLGAPVDVATDAAGNLYAAEFDNNEVVKIPAGGGAAVVLSSGFSGPFGVAVDAAGNVYVADAGNNAVKEIVAGSGAVNTIGSGFSGPTAVAVDGSGNVYVADNGNSALKEIPAGGGTPVTLQSGFASIQGVAVDAAGNIYVADAGVGTSGNGAVYKVPAGGGSMVSVGTGFTRPAAVAVDAAGNLYVTDINQSVITVVEPGGAQFTAGSGLNHANGITFDTSGNLYIADAGTGSLKEVKITGGYFLSAFLPAGLSFDNNTGILSGTPSASSPTANYTITGWNITGSAAATVSITVGAPIISYTSPVAYARGVAITPLTPTSTGAGVPGRSYAPPVAVASDITDATCLTIDKAGNMYIGQASGQVSKLVPGSSTAAVYATGFATIDPANTRQAIAIDTSGNLFFVDGVSLWKIPAGGATPVTLGSFSQPTAVAVDNAGNIYVTDDQGLRKIAGDGSGQSTIIPGGIEAVTVDGSGNLFFLSGILVYEIPHGGTYKQLGNASTAIDMVCDQTGNMYVLCFSGPAFKLFPKGGGSGVMLGPSVILPAASGLVVDANFNIYTASGTITRYSPNGGYFTNPELPDGLSINGNTGIISGTPSAVSPNTNYTVTAFNTSASAAAAVNIAIGQTPAISYSTPQTYTVGTAITALLPASTGGAVSAPAFNTPALTVSTGITDANCMAMDTHGNLYIGESSGKVSVLAPGSAAATVLASGVGSGTGSGSIAADASGNVYLADGTWLWKIPAGGGTPVKIDSHNPRQVTVGTDNTIYAGSLASGIYTIAPDGSNRTVIFSGGAGIMAVDQNGNAFFSSRGSGIGLHEVLPGGGQKTIIAGVQFRAFTTDPSGNVYIINPDLSIGMVSAGGSTESQVLAAVTGTTGIMIGPDLTLYTIVNGGIMKTNVSGGYFTSPELPAGLTMDPTTGAISGTPAAASAATNYTVTAFSGSVSSTATVNIKVNPPPSPDASLSNIQLSNGVLSPAFSPATNGYTAAVGFGLNTMTITPTASQPNATITVGGSPVASGTASSFIPLGPGFNSVVINVTAQDGVTTKTYIVNIIQAKSANNNLASFKTSAGLAQGLTVPAALTESVPYGLTGITVTPTAADFTATITVNGNPVTSGSPSAVIALAVGANTITTVVTALDGKVKTYTLTVTRAVSTNDNLAGLTLSNGTLWPTIGTATNFLTYVGYGLTTMTITPTAADPAATITVNGTTVASGTASSYLPLTVGKNTVSIVVTAPDGVGKKTYTLVINEARSQNNNLFSLRTSAGLAKGKTVPATLTENVVNAVTNVTVTPTVDDPTATVTVNGERVTSGTASNPVRLTIGKNAIIIVVTAQNLSTQTYTLSVSRATPSADDAVYQPFSVDKPAETPQLADDGINVHNGISPNGDGINDFLQIDNISQYPDNSLKIMNRNGLLVYEAKGYDNATKIFDGHSNKNGQMQLPGTYFYSLDYTVGGIIKHKTGYLVLKY